MPPPLTSEGQVTYAPGNPKPTVDQMAKDVAAFLVWTAEPKLEKPPRGGPCGRRSSCSSRPILGYLAYQNIWGEREGARSADRRARS